MGYSWVGLLMGNSWEMAGNLDGAPETWLQNQWNRPL